MSIDLQSRRSYFRFWMRRLLRFLTNPYHCQGFLLSTNFPFSGSDHAFPSFFFKFRSISSHRFTRFQPISRGKRKTIIAPRWQEGKQFSSPVASIRWIFDFSTVRPCRTDISYERWNNYTGLRRVAVSGRQKTILRSRGTDVPGDPVATFFSANYSPHEIDSPSRVPRKPTMSAIENAFNVPEMKYNADTLRCGSLEPRGGGRGVEGRR